MTLFRMWDVILMTLAPLLAVVFLSAEPRWNRCLTGAVVAPADRRPVRLNTACVLPSRGDRDEPQRGAAPSRHRRLAVVVRAPAHSRAVRSYAAAVITAGADLDERPGRRACLSDVVVAPARQAAIPPHPAA